MSQQSQEHADDEQHDEDEPDWTVVAVGGGLGYAIGGPIGGAAGAALSAWLSQAQDSEDPHDQVLARAAKNVREHASDSGQLYIAHVQPSEVGRSVEDSNPQGIVEEIDGDPDLLYIDVAGPRANLVVEVETRAGLFDHTDHTLDQLERYRATGFKRLLVVPDDLVATARDWVADHDDQLDGPLTVSSVENVATHF